MGFRDHIMPRMRRFADIKDYAKLPTVVILDASQPVKDFMSHMSELDVTGDLHRPQTELLNEALMYLSDEKLLAESVFQFATDVRDAYELVHPDTNQGAKAEAYGWIFIHSIHRCIKEQIGYTPEGLFPYDLADWIEGSTPALKKITDRAFWL